MRPLNEQVIQGEIRRNEEDSENQDAQRCEGAFTPARRHLKPRVLR